MASCAQVNSFIQAYVDGELEPSENTVLEAHLAECQACRREVSALTDFQQALVGSCAMHRLRRSLAPDVLAHLPEMDPVLNHGSHPTDTGVSPVRYAFRLPLALSACAAVLLACVAGLLLYPFDSVAPEAEAAGMVVHANGTGTLRREAGSARFEPVVQKSLVANGEELETLASATLEVALARGSSVKLNENTRVTIHDSRNVFVSKGQAFFDIGRDRRHFFVNTPSGEILVFGTTFVVDVLSDVTKVLVVEGDVLVSTAEGRSAVSHGKQASLRAGEAPAPAEVVQRAQAPDWAMAIKPDRAAVSLFRQAVESQEAPVVAVPAEAVYAVRNLSEREVDGILIQWDHDGVLKGHCGYFLHVSDSNDNLLFLDTIEGSIFDNADLDSLTLAPGEEPITGVDVIHIRLIPDYTGGVIESRLRVNAVVR